MGKGGSALSTWIKEFCTLVFIQSIQAFTYAIIIVVITRLQFSENILENSTKASAMGLFTIIALTSVFRIEELLRRIFGISPTKADHGSAVRSLAKVAMIGKVGKRLTDNLGKVTGGIGKRIKSRKDLKALNDEKAKDINDLNDEYRANRSKVTNPVSNSNSNSNTKPELSDEAKKYYEKAKEAKANGNLHDYNLYKGMAAGYMKAQKNAGSSSNSTGGNSKKYDYLSKYKAIQKDYEKQKKEIMDARKAGVKDIASGVFEFVGATVGGTTGAIIGVSDGNVDDLLSNTIAGAAVGDAAGEALIKKVEGLKNATKSAKYVGPKYSFAKQKNRAEKILDDLKTIQENVKNSNDVGDI